MTIAQGTLGHGLTPTGPLFRIRPSVLCMLMNLASLLRGISLLKCGLVLCILTAVAAGCTTGPPTASFDVDISSGEAPLDVVFSAELTNIHELRWDFGDGESTITVTSLPVTHRYTTAGDHQVTLTAIQEGTPPETITSSRTITVEPGPIETLVLDPALVQVVAGDRSSPSR